MTVKELKARLDEFQEDDEVRVEVYNEYLGNHPTKTIEHVGFFDGDDFVRITLND